MTNPLIILKYIGFKLDVYMYIYMYNKYVWMYVSGKPRPETQSAPEVASFQGGFRGTSKDVCPNMNLCRNAVHCSLYIIIIG